MHIHVHGRIAAVERGPGTVAQLVAPGLFKLGLCLQLGLGLLVFGKCTHLCGDFCRCLGLAVHDFQQAQHHLIGQHIDELALFAWVFDLHRQDAVSVHLRSDDLAQRFLVVGTVF